MNRAVLKLYALGYLLEVMGCDVLVEMDMVYLLLQETWVGEL